MAFDKWGKFNRETTVPLNIEYTKEPWRTDPDGKGLIFRYTRHVTKAYCYKGMTEAAAQACSSEMRRMYTRPFVQWWNLPQGMFPKSSLYDIYKSVASVNIVRREVVFDVQITVDETQEIFLSYLKSDYDLTAKNDRLRLEWEFKAGQYTHNLLYTRMIFGYFKYDED